MPELMEHPGQKTAESLNHLLKEYSQKLLELRQKSLTLIRGKSEEYEIKAWHDYVRNLDIPLMDLARHASQFIEHGGIDETTRIELRLRLAELESAQSALRFVNF